MRDTQKIIEVDRTVKEQCVLTKEEIVSYQVNKSERTINVEVKLFSNDTDIVRTESYRFFSNDFIDNPTDSDLWALIDAKRNKG